MAPNQGKQVQCYMDIKIGPRFAGRMVFEVRKCVCIVCMRTGVEGWRGGGDDLLSCMPSCCPPRTPPLTLPHHPQQTHTQLFTDFTPRTAENFRALCTGERCVWDAVPGALRALWILPRFIPTPRGRDSGPWIARSSNTHAYIRLRKPGARAR